MFKKIANLITWAIHHIRGGHRVKWESWASYLYYTSDEYLLVEARQLEELEANEQYHVRTHLPMDEWDLDYVFPASWVDENTKKWEDMIKLHGDEVRKSPWY